MSQALESAGDQDQVVAASGEAVGIKRADAGRCASDQGRALEGRIAHCVSPFPTARN